MSGVMPPPLAAGMWACGGLQSAMWAHGGGCNLQCAAPLAQNPTVALPAICNVGPWGGLQCAMCHPPCWLHWQPSPRSRECIIVYEIVGKLLLKLLYI